MRHYHQAAIESASGLQLIVALYDGLHRFLIQAAAACETGDVAARREAARRALNIIIHLQANLRADAGGQAAQTLADFYAAVSADILRASASASAALFVKTVREVRGVRDAWQAAAKDPSPAGIPPRDLESWQEQDLHSRVSPIRPEGEGAVPAWIA